MERFKGAVVIVTGATSGIGKAAAVEWGGEGANVIVAGRRQEKGEAVAREIRGAGGEAIYIRTDVTDEGSTKALVDQVMDRYGRIDIAFNNAGIPGDRFTLTADQTTEGWNAVMATNLTGVWFSMKYEVPEMLKAGQGVIINTASFFGFVGSNIGIAPYVASKHGVIGLTRSAALEYARKGLRINAVCPGYVLTELVEPSIQNDPERFNAAIDANVPLGRIGEAREIARAVLWLASDDASYMTGQTLNVDGGVISA